MAAARLGAQVRFVGRIGTDDFVLRSLEAEGVDVSGVVRDVSQAPGWMEHVVSCYATPATLARLGAPAAFDELQLRVADATADRAAKSEHDIGVAVVGTAIAIFLGGAAELAHGDDGYIFHAVAEILIKRRQSLAEVVQQVRQLPGSPGGDCRPASFAFASVMPTLPISG